MEAMDFRFPRRAYSVLREDEAKIIKSITDGNTENFRVLVERYKHSIFSLVFRQTSDHTLSSDLTQEIFIKAYRNLSHFRFEAQFSTWLTRIALNHLNSFFRSATWKRTQRESQKTLEDFSTSEPNPEEKHLQKEKIRTLQKAISNLKPKLRNVVHLCAIEGHSYEKVAQVLGVPVGTVRSRLNSARLQLTKKMKL